MVRRRRRDASDARIAALVAACSALVACASTPAGPPSGAGVRGLFRAGPSSYPTALSPHALPWYSPAKSPQFSKTGRAVWQGEGRRRGLAAWLARALGRKPAGGPPPAVIATDATLPVPSMAMVTNLETYATTEVRVEQRAALGGALIALSRDTARGLGVEAGRPLTVRVRYAGPVVAYRERPDVRQVLRRPGRRDIQLASASASAPAPAPAPAAAPPALATAPAAAVADAAAPSLRPAFEPPSAVRLRGPAASIFRVQAGTFALHGNAERAVTLLKPAGQARIETVRRGAATLYRVSLWAPQDAARAEALRRRVVKIGFADARLVRS